MEIIQVPVSPGEVLDKITILEIKSERIKNSDKLVNIRHELELLREVWRRAVTPDVTINDLRGQLKSINATLWDIEDEIRGCERARDFGQRFVDLARQVYRINDQRAGVKQKLNCYLGSVIVEEKSYRDY